MSKGRATCHAAWMANACIAFGLLGCGGSAEQVAGPQTSGAAIADGADGPALPAGALGASWQSLAVPGATNNPDLASTPIGYLALSRRSVGDAKAPSAWESYLYRSTDGIRWQQIALSEDNHDLWLRGVAYGAGHYVLAGMRFGGGDGVIFHSTDGEHYTEIPVATGAPSGLADVVFAGGRFFAFSTFRTISTSTDGTSWSSIDLATTVMPLDVAFGNEQFLLVGSGDVQLSADGRSWAATPLDCAMPGACITDPSGNVLQGLHSRAVFSAGTFFIAQAKSNDGRAWQALPGRYPRGGVGGQVIGSTETDELAIWSTDQAPQALTHVRYVDTLPAADRAASMRWNGAVQPSEVAADNFPSDVPLPDRLEFPVPGGADCTTASCVIVDNQLFLITGQP